MTDARAPESLTVRLGLSRAGGFALNVDLSLPGRGVTAIFGPSGSGKTTLLRCIAGLEAGATGELHVNGQTWLGPGVCLPTHKRPLAYVFQEASLLPHLTARQNLAYAARRASGRGTGAAESPGNASAVGEQDVIDRMGIAPLLDRKPGQLSGGERQRVAIARALLARPRLLLMDEPLAALDAARKEEILPYIEQIRDLAGVPVLYVSHSVTEVARLADQVVAMNEGRVVGQGAVAEVLSGLDIALPEGEDTGVVWQGPIVEQRAEWHLSRVACAGGDLWIQQGAAIRPGLSDGEVRVRIQARDVSLSLEPLEQTSIINHLPAVVESISEANDGAQALVRLRAAGQPLVARITRFSAHHLGLRTGQPVWAHIKSVAIVR